MAEEYKGEDNFTERSLKDYFNYLLGEEQAMENCSVTKEQNIFKW